MGEIKQIEITRAEDLPIEIQKKYNVYSGFVEVRFETHLEIDFKVIPLDESPADRMRKSMLKAGITQGDFLKENLE